MIWMIGAIAAAIVLYPAAIRPWFLRWGATQAETALKLPGDPLVAEPNSTSTRAITIGGPCERVWPWLVQIGQGRGGFYSYTWLENLFGCRIRNAETIHAEWQDLKPGDSVCLHPGAPGLEVAEVERDRCLVLGGAGLPEKNMPSVSWAFVLRKVEGGATRLVVRWRSRSPVTFGALLANKYLLEPIHFTMERKMLLGIQARVERRVRA